MARYGLDSESMRQRHPRLIYCSITGYGHTGPMRDEAGYDFAIQAQGGLMSVTGAADGATLRKTLMRDLMPDLRATKGPVLEKIEGLAVLASGDVMFVTDNDGVNDNSGETQLVRLGKILN